MALTSGHSFEIDLYAFLYRVMCTMQQVYVIAFGASHFEKKQKRKHTIIFACLIFNNKNLYEGEFSFCPFLALQLNILVQR